MTKVYPRTVSVKHQENVRSHIKLKKSKTIVGQVDSKAKMYLSFCLELQSAKSTYQHVDLDLHWWNTQRLEFYSRSSEVSRVFFNFQNDLQKQN